MVQSEETRSCCVESAVAESKILDLQFAFSTVHSTLGLRPTVNTALITTYVTPSF
jgi:hypothetical protein